ncbi:hypothetical protein Ddye_019464 [Dipteronia dyeriana]|uniref:Reverse transcriptase domain-containing protein n=1 Tax=Dipteronia dyeriana TaxID=168575 RepID=A0AAD9TYX7_9ROSI|nr:hypothetical protein Ddye_019464 [Dipteronia dyeriana]
MDLIMGEKFGRWGVNVSHLQFADDTIVFLQSRSDYLLNLKRILRCFELSSSLTINFHKSCIVRVRKNEAIEACWVDLFKCRKVTLPLQYLGLPFGNR